MSNSRMPLIASVNLKARPSVSLSISDSLLSRIKLICLSIAWYLSEDVRTVHEELGGIRSRAGRGDPASREETGPGRQGAEQGVAHVSGQVDVEVPVVDFLHLEAYVRQDWRGLGVFGASRNNNGSD